MSAHTDESQIQAESEELPFFARVSQLGIEFESNVWVLPRQHDVPSDAPSIIRWSSLSRWQESSTDVEATFVRIMKCIAAVWLVGGKYQQNLLKPSTIKVHLSILRTFLVDVPRLGHTSLETLTAKQVQRWFLASYSIRANGAPVKERSANQAMHALRELYLLRADIGTGLSDDPFPPKIRKQMLRHFQADGCWQAPPQPVCMALLRSAIRLIGTPADDIIRIVHKYGSGIEQGRERGLRSHTALSLHGRTALAGETFSTIAGEAEPWTHISPIDVAQVAQLMRRVQDACFIAITYTSGARVSEVRRAMPGSVRLLKHTDGSEHAYYFAPRSKRRRRGASINREDQDNPDAPWILSAAATRALEVLERLSEPLRRRSGIQSLWVSFSGSGLWPQGLPRRGFHVLSGNALNDRLKAFAAFVGLSAMTGWTGRLHSHMGRKCLARFIAMRDRTALEDLALQFSHLSAHSVDIGYARPDSEYRRLIREELAEDLEKEAIATAQLPPSHIYHSMDEAKFLQWHQRFAKLAGQLRRKDELIRLIAKGAAVFPGLWGGCAYRSATSACHGGEHGPNPVERSPLTCKSCTNFRALPEHAPWWHAYKQDCLNFLSVSGTPEQTKLLLRQRLAHANEVLGRIAGAGND